MATAVPARRSKPEILVADDHSDILSLFTHLLPHCAVTTAASGAQAVDSIRGSAFDLYLLDYDLGDMDGGELCARIRSVEPNAPIFIYSGREEIVVDAAPWTAWIEKRVSVEDVCDRIDEALYRQNLVNETAVDLELAAIADDVRDRDALLSARMSELGERIRRQWARHCDVRGMRNALHLYLASGGTRASFMEYWRPLAPDVVAQLPSQGDA